MLFFTKSLAEGGWFCLKLDVLVLQSVGFFFGTPVEDSSYTLSTFHVIALILFCWV